MLDNLLTLRRRVMSQLFDSVVLIYEKGRGLALIGVDTFGQIVEAAVLIKPTGTSASSFDLNGNSQLADVVIRSYGNLPVDSPSKGHAHANKTAVAEGHGEITGDLTGLLNAFHGIRAKGVSESKVNLAGLLDAFNALDAEGRSESYVNLSGLLNAFRGINAEGFSETNVNVSGVLSIPTPIDNEGLSEAHVNLSGLLSAFQAAIAEGQSDSFVNPSGVLNAFFAAHGKGLSDIRFDPTGHADMPTPIDTKGIADTDAIASGLFVTTDGIDQKGLADIRVIMSSILDAADAVGFLESDMVLGVITTAIPSEGDGVDAEGGAASEVSAIGNLMEAYHYTVTENEAGGLSYDITADESIVEIDGNSVVIGGVA